MMFVAAMLIVLPAVAQTFGTQKAEQPNAAFQSTSTMMGSGSTYSANPTLNTDGTASYNGASGPRRAKMDDPSVEVVVPPIVDIPDPEALVPLGDAVLPLLLMSLAFCGYVYFRRKRSEA